MIKILDACLFSSLVQVCFLLPINNIIALLIFCHFAAFHLIFNNVPIFAFHPNAWVRLPVDIVWFWMIDKNYISPIRSKIARLVAMRCLAHKKILTIIISVSRFVRMYSTSPKLHPEINKNLIFNLKVYFLPSETKRLMMSEKSRNVM